MRARSTDERNLGRASHRICRSCVGPVAQLEKSGNCSPSTRKGNRRRDGSRSPASGRTRPGPPGCAQATEGQRLIRILMPVCPFVRSSRTSVATSVVDWVEASASAASLLWVDAGSPRQRREPCRTPARSSRSQTSCRTISTISTSRISDPSVSRAASRSALRSRVMFPVCVNPVSNPPMFA